MRLYLESITPEAVTDIGQYVPLSGVIVSQQLLISREADPKTVLEALSEVLPAASSILVNVLPGNFRTMLTESRKLKSLYPSLIPMFAADPQSYMACKACHTAKIPAAISNVMYPEQAWFADMNKADLIVVPLKTVSQTIDVVGLLRSLQPLYDRLLVCDFADPDQIRLCMNLGIQNLGISEDLFKILIDNPVSHMLASEMREEWVMAFTRDTLLP